ncbi:MAG: site-2 protease family protein [Armatimonadetes bacterium]|nr:site-2 protease family protein [Armatimonadota bacterium]
MARRRPTRDSIWSIKIGNPFGIPLRLHITFVLFLIWLVMLAYREQDRSHALLVPSIFVCVVLHEFGHALVAKRFGIKTRDVTLYPVGGMAMLETRPKPREELWIALAGPAVNVLIALAIYPIAVAVEGKPPSAGVDLEKATYLQGLFAANVFLPLFNLIPALPMDGGRVLRALLALKYPEVQATRMSGAIAQLMAMAMGFWGLVDNNIMLTVIALLVFVGAGQEVQTAVGLAIIEGKRVSEAMMTDFQTLSSGATLSEAADLLLKSSQTGFPIVVGDEVLGLLTRDGIVRGLASEGQWGYVAGHMDRQFARLVPDQPMEDALRAIGSSSGTPALVFEEDRLVGMVSAENLAEFMMLQQAMQRR